MRLISEYDIQYAIRVNDKLIGDVDTLFMTNSEDSPSGVGLLGKYLEDPSCTFTEVFR